MEVPAVFQEILVKNAYALQIGYVLFAEVELLYVFDQLLDAAHDGIAASEGIGAEEGIEDDRLVLVLVLEVALHHGQLVQVGQQCQILSVHSISLFLL